MHRSHWSSCFGDPVGGALVCQITNLFHFILRDVPKKGSKDTTIAKYRKYIHTKSANLLIPNKLTQP